MTAESGRLGKPEIWASRPQGWIRTVPTDTLACLGAFRVGPRAAGAGWELCAP